MKRRLSTLRGRLMLVVLAALCLVLIIDVVAASVGLRALVASQSGNRLRDDLRIALRSTDLTTVDTPGDLGLYRLARRTAANGVATAIVDSNGATLDSVPAGNSDGTTSFSVPAQALVSKPGLDGQWETSEYFVGGSHYLQLTANLPTKTPRTAILVQNVAADDALIRNLLLLCGGIGLAIVLLGCAVVLPLLIRALGPLTTVTQTATAVAAGDLDRRVSAGSRRDEVGQLSTAFDQMVDRLHDAITSREVAADELRAHDAVMREMLANVSHELRTPLTAISGSAEVLLEGKVSDKAYAGEALGHISREASRLGKLVDSLLLLSSSQAGVLATHAADHSLREFVQRFLEMWRDAAAGHELHVETPALDCTIHADVDSLARAIANLVDNAAKFAPAGSPIYLACDCDAAKLSVIFTVRDSGPGVQEDDLDRMFDAFYRSPSARRETKGTGLGLAIVAGVAAAHHGTHGARHGSGGFEVWISVPTTTPASDHTL